MIRLTLSLFLLLLSLSLHAVEAEAIYLTWMQDPTSTMTVQWLTKNDDTADDLEFQLIDQKEWKSVTGTHTPLPQEEPYLMHLVELTDLLPNSSYRFRIKNAKESHLFRTMPKTLSQPIVFTTGGDTNQIGMNTFELTNQQAVKEEPLFTVFGGDLAYASPNDIRGKEDAARWINWLITYSKSMVTPSGYKVPLLVTLGNHDIKGFYGRSPNEAPFFFTLFATPGLPGYKSLQCGDYLTLFLLDSNHANPIKGAQAEWLRNELAKASQSLHRFAFYHVPAYPSVRAFHAKESTMIRRHWVPLFERYALSCAFENNDHAYKRTFPLIDDEPHPYGVLYLGDGAWGVKPRQTKKAHATSYLAKVRSTQHFIKVKLSESEREYTAISPSGEIVDHYVQFIK